MNPNDMTIQQLCDLFGYAPKGRPLDTKEVAEVLGVHPSTVDHYRLRGVGPRHFSPPGTRRVWYAERDVMAWMLSGLRHSTSEPRDLQMTNTSAALSETLGTQQFRLAGAPAA
ncbi:helix-turn-helix transcriptional regulator [Sinorhizobium fredii]|uniref:helix-turn-helix transcriptional regulator n=1 Tax=Rhizobium fredii TaxID=380 RepID=UPI0035136123